jgi:murein DD-endopeptidase MepM/ murein hydrolase activator NlpD
MPRLLRQAHNAHTTWRDGLVVKFMLGRQGVVYRLSPWLIVGCFLLLGVGVRAVLANQAAREERLRQRIASLEEDKRQALTFLQRKEREKKQALALAQLRSDELWDELKARDKQMDQIWKVVGKNPTARSNKRRSMSASRSRTHPLVLKRRYLELQKALHGDDGEMKKLRTAAVSYRKEKVRQAKLALWSTRPTLWPCDGYFSSPFGYRIHPILGYARFHSGCDISASTGTPIRATAAGRVTGADYLGGYGLAVTIDHGAGLTTLYGHCSAVSVRSGDYVRKGQIVASVGSTGMSTGPHCHYEVHQNGAQIDPSPFMQTHR